MRGTLRIIALLLGSGLFAVAGRAQGVIVLPDRHPAPLELRTHRVEARVEDEIAVVTVTQTFYNPGGGTVEGTFLFPLPPGAQVSRFSMTVDGREMAGELLEADEARAIYEEIVRRSLDPALLEMADYRTFRARIFPIPGRAERTITLRYDAALEREGDLVTFRHPMQGHLATRHTGAVPLPRPIDSRRPQPERPDAPDAVPTESTVHITLATSTGLTNVYSPSHEVRVDRSGRRTATVTLEQPRLDGRDFVLYYSLDPSPLGATLLAHRPYGDRPGYFLLLVSAPAELDEARIPPKDIVFVLDTSGSMAGEKMAQAREALRYCLQRLGPHDRFGLVAFSSDVDAFRDSLVTTAMRDDALFFVDQLEARGGTNINAALLTALEMLDDSDHGQVIFLTDGLPSTGVRDEGQIRRNVAEANDGGVRLFAFGVGYDVNTRLLDGLSQATGAFADYISPEEHIEERIGAFYDKVRFPVMTDLALEADGGDVFALTPGTLPDLYRGGRLLVAGRYRQPGDLRLALRGRLGDAAETLRYTFELPRIERERDFVARLWATRRVGALLDEMRLHGENEELKEEVIALAREFGIVTPCTSYLVTEDEALAVHPPGTPRGGPARPLRFDAAAPTADLRATSGEEAVAMSKATRAMQEAEVVAPAAPSVLTTVLGRTLRRTADGAWADVDADPEAADAVRIAFASDAYFALLRLHPELREAARLGPHVTIAFRGRVLVIAEDGENLSETALRQAFGG
ncbi:MAG: VWA domain-containing protein [Bacteroidetes bacterium]|nr:MAG: VWA domain-containing protein [Bacteroidota bacterium]